MRRPSKERTHLSGRGFHAGFHLDRIDRGDSHPGAAGGLVVPRLFKHATQAKITVTKAQIAAFQTALGAYKLDTGQFPQHGPGLASAADTPPGRHQLEWSLLAQGHSLGSLEPALCLQVPRGAW